MTTRPFAPPRPPAKYAPPPSDIAYPLITDSAVGRSHTGLRITDTLPAGLTYVLDKPEPPAATTQVPGAGVLERGLVVTRTVNESPVEAVIAPPGRVEYHV